MYTFANLKRSKICFLLSIPSFEQKFGHSTLQFFKSHIICFLDANSHFQTRLRQDLRTQVPSDWEINIRCAGSKDAVDPSLCAWKGGSMMVKTGAYSSYSLSKKIYQEYGPDACKRKFHWYT
mmetsp:Transcript_23730/g.33218  ORF Transcript_23730/g.33218 Transcript_23730/m.33218 type:complete len:122 (-) Transcript_23730:56-421(-)